MDLLDGVRRRHPDVVAEVRGKGLMIGVELQKEGYAGSVILELARRLVIGVYTLNQPKVIRFEPPLVIDREQVKTAVRAFEEAVEKTERDFLSPRGE
jgi:putrescine aminotransferase